MPGLRRGYLYRGCLFNLNMNYEEMILFIAKNGLASKVIKKVLSTTAFRLVG